MTVFDLKFYVEDTLFCRVFILQVPGKQSEDGHSTNAVQLTETKREKHFIEQTFTAKQSKSVNELFLLIFLVILAIQ